MSDKCPTCGAPAEKMVEAAYVHDHWQNTYRFIGADALIAERVARLTDQEIASVMYAGNNAAHDAAPLVAKNPLAAYDAAVSAVRAALNTLLGGSQM